MYATIIGILAILTALAGTVLAFIFILPDKKRAQLPKFLQFLHDFFNCKILFLELCLKALHIFLTLAVCVFGVFMIFVNPLAGIGIIIGGVIALRLLHEGVMLMIMVVTNTNKINKKLGEDNTNNSYSNTSNF